MTISGYHYRIGSVSTVSYGMFISTQGLGQIFRLKWKLYRFETYGSRKTKMPIPNGLPALIIAVNLAFHQHGKFFANDCTSIEP